MASLVSALTQAPRYVGWVQRGAGSPAYVFNTDAGSVLVAWAQAGDAPVLDLGGTVTVVDPKTGSSTSASSVQLSSSPIIASPVPDALAQEARNNRFSPYLWGGDFSNAPSVSFTAPSTMQGLHVLGSGPTVTVDGEQARDCSTTSAQVFTVDPNFLSYTSAPIMVTAVLRANARTTAQASTSSTSRLRDITAARRAGMACREPTSGTRHVDDRRSAVRRQMGLSFLLRLRLDDVQRI